MILLIPAYEPTEKLLLLLENIKTNCNLRTLIIDDGSNETFQPIFLRAEYLGSTVLHHPKNLGKGAALKTGFRYLMDMGEDEGVVCADCDGQHSVEDICNIAQETSAEQKKAILGVREFTNQVPFRSRLGNKITVKVFSLFSKYRIQDTQTGLRGYPAMMLPWLCGIEGERFEYEMNVLLKLKEPGYSIKEVVIKTIYEEGNKSSHFRPFVDSFKIYFTFLKFTASSMASGLIDYILLLVFANFFSQLLPAVLLSRSISSICNYNINQHFVFSGEQKIFQSAVKYSSLVFINVWFNYLLLEFYVYLGIHLAIAKIVTEITLYFFSYTMQKYVVFKKVINNK